MKNHPPKPTNPNNTITKMMSPSKRHPPIELVV